MVHYSNSHPCFCVVIAICFTFSNAINPTLLCYCFCFNRQLFFEQIFYNRKKISYTYSCSYNFQCLLFLFVNLYFHLIYFSLSLKDFFWCFLYCIPANDEFLQFFKIFYEIFISFKFSKIFLLWNFELTFFLI